MPAKSGTKKSPAPKKTAPKSPTQPDPTTDAALLALSPDHADAPDMPVDIAQQEIASLARLARSCSDGLAGVGIDAARIQTLARFADALEQREATWQRARRGVKITAAERRQLEEAEALDAKLLAGGRWACRKDPAAIEELGRIAEGSGVADTIQDLRDLAAFWGEHAAELAHTKITKKDLARAVELADALAPAAEKEALDATAAQAQELRNRCFWAANELATEIREGGRYAFNDQPMLAAKFTSRYRAAVVRRSRRKAKETKRASGPNAAAPTPAPNGT